MSVKLKEKSDVDKLQRIKENFGAYIKGLRKDRELSQWSLANSAGLSKGYIGHLESKREGWNHPSESALLQLAKALNVNSDEMLGKGQRISKDIQDIIFKHPIEICAFLRGADAEDWNAKDWEDVTVAIK